MMSESTANLLQSVREGLRALADELAAGKSDRLQAALDFAASFHRHSLRNQALIAQQCPQAIYIASYRTWQKLGYQVRKGARGIRILAPRPYMITADDGAEEQHVAFVAVSVFDASQLNEPPALPVHRAALPDDQRELADAVQAAIETEGIRVEERDDLGIAEGWSAGGRIAVRRGADSHNRVLIMLHEWAREVPHQGESKALARERKEAQAESVAYVVSRHFGFPHPYAASYLESWGALTLADLERELDAVLRAADHMIERLGAGSRVDACPGLAA